MVLPEPDSPTTPSVSPLRTSTLTPSTALMKPTVFRDAPRLTGNHTFRSFDFSTISPEGLGCKACGRGSAASSAQV